MLKKSIEPDGKIAVLPTNFMQQLRNVIKADSADVLGLNVFFLLVETTSRGFRVSLDSPKDKILIEPRSLSVQSERFSAPSTDRVQKPFLSASAGLPTQEAIFSSGWNGIDMDAVLAGRSLTHISRNFNSFGPISPATMTFTNLHNTISFLKSKARSFQGQHYSLLLGQEINIQVIDFVDIRTPLELKDRPGGSVFVRGFKENPNLTSKSTNKATPSIHVDFRMLEDQSTGFLRGLAWAIDAAKGDFLFSFIPVIPKPPGKSRSPEEYYHADLSMISLSLRYYKVESWVGGTVLTPKIYLKGTRSNCRYMSPAIVQAFFKASMLNVVESLYNASVCIETKPSRIIEMKDDLVSTKNDLDFATLSRYRGEKQSIVFADGVSSVNIYLDGSTPKNSVGFELFDKQMLDSPQAFRYEGVFN